MARSTVQRLTPLVLAKSGGKCWYCGGELTDESRAVDHFVPVCAGGSDELYNLVPSCSECNGMKSSKSLEEFRRVATGMPKFSDEQIFMLKKLGVTNIESKIQTHIAKLVFWFEREENHVR